ncbi:MAG: SDR family oxidoreductase [Actinomycetota bacterium]|nr:SDR family oxidoreductase [Actinomycetota bacterium]
MKLEGSSAIVTGAGSGLGAATAAALAAKRVKVIGIDLPAAVVRETSFAPAGVHLVAANVTDEDEVLAALAQLDAAHPLRLVVNCAGIAPARRILSSKGTHDLASFRAAIEINLIGTFNVMRLAAEAMSKNEPVDDFEQRGLIVNTASVAAYEGQIGQIAYSASKGGVVAMTITAARDLALHGIRVNTIAPGIMDTPMLAALGPEVNASLAASVTFPRRLGIAEEYAQLVLMLADHDYLNGETFRMDGGIRMSPR